MRGNQLGTPMTQQQTAVLDFVRRFMQTEGLPPTRAEVARGMGFRSNNAAEEHLQALARRGVIRLTRGRSRGITILNG